MACGRLGLLHAAALFLHASFGASVRAQYAAVAGSKLAGAERRGRRAAAEAAQLPILGRLCAALRPDGFDDARLQRLLADAASGQPLTALLEALEVSNLLLRQPLVSPISILDTVFKRWAYPILHASGVISREQ